MFLRKLFLVADIGWTVPLRTLGLGGSLDVVPPLPPMDPALGMRLDLPGDPLKVPLTGRWRPGAIPTRFYSPGAGNALSNFLHKYFLVVFFHLRRAAVCISIWLKRNKGWVDSIRCISSDYDRLRCGQMTWRSAFGRSFTDSALSNGLILISLTDFRFLGFSQKKLPAGVWPNVLGARDAVVRDDDEPHCSHTLGPRVCLLVPHLRLLMKIPTYRNPGMLVIDTRFLLCQVNHVCSLQSHCTTGKSRN